MSAKRARSAMETRIGEEWMGLAPQAEPMFYVDGHVRVYQARGATGRAIMCHARNSIYGRAWITGSTPWDGQPFVYINQEIDHGLVQALREDVIPWVEAHAA